MNFRYFPDRYLEMGLADDSLAGRGLGTPQLDRAADYIAEQFRSAGLRPGGDNEETYFQTWQHTVEGLSEPVTLKNEIAILPGSRMSEVSRLADDFIQTARWCRQQR